MKLTTVIHYTGWFKYDRDICGWFTKKSVPVIFEPPCIFLSTFVSWCINHKNIYGRNNIKFRTARFQSLRAMLLKFRLLGNVTLYRLASISPTFRMIAVLTSESSSSWPWFFETSGTGSSSGTTPYIRRLHILILTLTHWGRVTQICVFTLQLCKTGDANLRFYITTLQDGWRKFAFLHYNCARRVTQICVFTLQLCKTRDANLRF